MLARGRLSDNAARDMVAKRLDLTMNFARLGLAAGVGALNAGGKALSRVGFDAPALDLESLKLAARRRARLDDFGDWPLGEPLTRLLESYRAEACLTTLGRVTVRELIISLLETLLQLEAERARTPRLENESIEAPVFIVGLPRTGTTLLHGLLSADPANRVPRTWEVMYPAGFPNDSDGIARAHRQTAARLAWANRLAPQFRKIHPIAPDLPQECIAITAQVFMSIQFHTTHNVPSYEDWFENDSQQLAYAYHHRFLQHAQARGPAGRWVLKAPGHLFALDALLDRYDDARIIQMHRDPLRVMASMASHASVLRRAFSDRVDPGQVAADWTARWAGALEKFLTVRNRARAERFFDVSYDDIVSAPLATVERVYEFLGWTLSDEAQRAMGEYLDANPKNKHGAHRYSLAEYGLDRDTEIERFARYCKRFDIAVQADSRPPAGSALPREIPPPR